MHIKNIHSMIEKLSEVAKCELDKGIENIDTKEMKEVAEIISELCEAEVQAKISKAMDEAEADENLEMYEKHGMKYYNNRRYENGRYAPKGRGRRYFMPEMDMEYDYDMSEMIMPRGRMYYGGGQSGNSGSQGGTTSGHSSSGGSTGGMRSYGGNMYYGGDSQRENRYYGGEESKEAMMSKYDKAKEGYKHSKEAKDGSHMKSLEEYMRSLADDMSEIISGMDASEKALMKTKLTGIMQRVQ